MKYYKSNDGWVCGSCGKLAKSEMSVIAHLKHCKGIQGILTDIARTHNINNTHTVNDARTHAGTHVKKLVLIIKKQQEELKRQRKEIDTLKKYVVNHLTHLNASSSWDILKWFGVFIIILMLLGKESETKRVSNPINKLENKVIDKVANVLMQSVGL